MYRLKRFAEELCRESKIYHLTHRLFDIRLRFLEGSATHFSTFRTDSHSLGHKFMNYYHMIRVIVLV
jgi:hypothetical protein